MPAVERPRAKARRRPRPRYAPRGPTHGLLRGVFLAVPLTLALGLSLAGTTVLRWGLEGLREDAGGLGWLLAFSAILGLASAFASGRWSVAERAAPPDVSDTLSLLRRAGARALVTGVAAAVVLPLALDDWWLASLQYVSHDHRSAALALFGFGAGIATAPLALLERPGGRSAARRVGALLAALALAAGAVLAGDALAGFTLRSGWEGSLAANVAATWGESWARLDRDSALNLGAIALVIAADALVARRRLSLAADTLVTGLVAAVAVPVLAALHTAESAWGVADMAIFVLVRGPLCLAPVLPLARHLASALERRGLLRGAAAGLAQLAALGAAFVWVDSWRRETGAPGDPLGELVPLGLSGVVVGLAAALLPARRSPPAAAAPDDPVGPRPAAIARRLALRGLVLGLGLGALALVVPAAWPGLAGLGARAGAVRGQALRDALRVYPFALGLVGAAVAWVEVSAASRRRGRRSDVGAALEAFGLALAAGLVADLGSLHLAAYLEASSFGAAQLALHGTLEAVAKTLPFAAGALVPVALVAAAVAFVRRRGGSPLRQTLVATGLGALLAVALIALEPQELADRWVLGLAPRALLAITPVVPFLAEVADRLALAVEARLFPHEMAHFVGVATPTVPGIPLRSCMAL